MAPSKPEEALQLVHVILRFPDSLNSMLAGMQHN